MTDDPKARWRKINEDQLAAALTDAADRVKAQLTLAQDALKALLLANGGALVALFTFVGNVLTKRAGVRFDLHHLWLAFVLFVLGFALALVAYALAFLSQDRFYNQSMAEAARLTRTLLADERDADQHAEARLHGQGQGLYLLGIVVALGSVGCFVAGSEFALAGVLI